MRLIQRELVWISDGFAKAGGSINTARARLKELVRLGYLQPKGKGLATTYFWTMPKGAPEHEHRASVRP